MRRLFLIFLLAPMFIALAPSPVSASPPSSDPATAAAIAATWVAHQVNGQGFIPQAGNPNTPNLSNTAQAVVAPDGSYVTLSMKPVFQTVTGGQPKVLSSIIPGGK